MKHIFLKFSAIVLSAGLFASCSGFLEEVNPTGLTTLFDSETKLEADMNGLYSPLLTAASIEENFGTAAGLWQYGSTGASNYTGDRFVSTWDFTQWSQTSENSTQFSGFYSVASKANMMMSALPSSPVGEDYKKELEAECKFVRAVSYLWLVAMYGDVPVWLAPPTPENATNCPRTKYDQVYRQVVEDLLYAEKYMRSPARVEELTPNTGRPNKFAATAHLSTAYLYIGSLLSHPDDNFWDTTKPERLPDFYTGWPEGYGVHNATEAYQKSLEFAEKLIPESSTHDPECTYALVEKIQDLFQFSPDFSRNGYNSYKHPEMIYTHLSSMSSTTQNTWSRNLTPDLAPGTHAPTASNCNRTRPNRFVFQKWCETYPGKKGTSTFANIYQTSTDPRVAATLYCEQYKNTAGTTIKPYPLTLGTSKATWLPSTKKYWSQDYLAAYFTTASNYWMRFAEVYLNAAEAAAYLDNETLARKYMEVLHKRARHSVADGKADSTQPDWSGLTFANKDELIKAIFWDRQFELLAEGKEFIDTHRFGATFLRDVIAIPLNDFIMLPEQSAFFGTSKVYSGSQRRIYTEDVDKLRRSLIVPIPLTEIQSNAGIPSAANDFWWGK